MRPTKNGYVVVTSTCYGPYQAWAGDKYTCPECGHEVVTGFGRKPFAEHFEDTFESRMKGYEDNGELSREVFK